MRRGHRHRSRLPATPARGLKRQPPGRSLAAVLLALLCAGALLAAEEDPGGGLRLVEALAAEGQWDLTRAESLRLMLRAPEPPADGRVSELAAQARAQLTDGKNRLAESEVSPRQPAWSSIPSRLLVGFYRWQVGPAIGMRCELHPSCSAYLLEACRAHGLLGFALMADRLYREPAVSAAREQVITLPDGRIRTADPLGDHDFWMKEMP